MRRRSGSVAAAALAALAIAAPAAQASKDPLNAYRVKPTVENKQRLAAAGFDLTEADHGRYLEVFATRTQARELRADGVRAQQVTAFQAAADPADYTGSDAAWTVWTRYDAVPNDGKEQYEEQYDRVATKPFVKKESIGTTRLGRPIWALKVTKNADTEDDNTKPAVLYNAIQHAREWLAGETCRRTLDFVVDNYGRTGDALDSHGDPIEGVTAASVTELVDTRELWFVCISNPDGYEYTFIPDNRLWRKNMADNDGDGVLGEPEDGVDPNRNFATNWGRDNEGSSDDPTSETFRGSGPDSEPETTAMKSLWDRVDFRFQKNDHTAAELLLYPQGFQQYTPTPDNAIFEALAGNDVDSAIADKAFDPGEPDDPDDDSWTIQDSPLDEDTSANRFDPDLSAELYITNGDTLDDAYHTHGILGFTPEGSEPAADDVSGFEFQDDEDDVEAEFQRHLLFSLDLARSAATPAQPVSHLGNGVQNFYVDDFAVSYGDPQPVEVVAKRSLGNVRMRYRINDGKVQQAPTKEAPGGERFNNDPGVYYHRLRGEVKGTTPGDEVEVWFEAASGPQHSSHFTYTAKHESGSKVLILAAEDYLAGNPGQDPNGPHYLSYYTDALDANGVSYDIYDVDKRGHVAPDLLGVLKHYQAVIWYTGDDYLTRMPGQPPGTGTARLAVEEMIAVRAFLNEGGKLLYTGKRAGQQYAEGNEFRNFGFPEPDGAPPAGDPLPLNVLDPQYCNKNGTDADPSTDAFDTWPEFDEDDPTKSDGCIPHNDDFLQYYLGAYIYVSGGNSALEPEEGGYFPFNMTGTGAPFGGLTWGFDETGAGNQDHTATFAITSSLLDPQRYPLYADSRSLASWLRPGAGPFSPFSGQYYMASNAHSGAYKRLGKTIDLTGKTSGELTFKFSSDLEQDWDYMIVEAHNLDDDTWTTLPDTGGLTDTGTGDSCEEGLANGSDALHPWLLHYYNTECEPTAETGTGTWNAFTGNSSGWQDWTVDLTPFAGKHVELFITNVTDWGTLGLGTWIDDVKLTLDGAVVESTDFESGTGGWEPAPPPEGTDFDDANWTRSTQQFTEGGVVGTTDTIYTGFGFEGISAPKRPEFMKRALKYLGVLKDNPGQGQGQGGTPSAKHAMAKLKIGKRLRVNRKGKVRVRVNCSGDEGSSCMGKVKLKRKKRVLGSKRFAIAAGKTATVTVKLKKSAFKALKKTKRGKKITVAISGKDAAGAMIAVRQTVRLLPPKKKR